MSVNVHQSTWHDIQEDLNLHMCNVQFWLLGFSYTLHCGFTSASAYTAVIIFRMSMTEGACSLVYRPASGCESGSAECDSIKYRESAHGATKLEKLKLHTNNSMLDKKIDKDSKWLNIPKY
jgi:hypothetical protein